jgi:hypothetical protein
MRNKEGVKMTIYIVKCKDEEFKFLDVKSAVKEAEILGESGKNTYVYKEVDGVREEEPFFSCWWEI